MREEARLARKLREVLESLYDSTRHYNIVDHALAAYLLRREGEVLGELPDSPRNLREALATLLVANDAKRALKAVEVLERRYRKRLKSTFPYSVIALDILLDRGLYEPAGRLYAALRGAGVASISAPAEDAYVAFAVLERAARSLGTAPPARGRVGERPEAAFRALVDFALRGDREALGRAEYRSVLGWISTRLEERRYVETCDGIEVFSAEIPPPLFFSPARLYAVWKFLTRALGLEA